MTPSKLKDARFLFNEYFCNNDVYISIYLWGRENNYVDTEEILENVDNQTKQETTDK